MFVVVNNEISVMQSKVLISTLIISFLYEELDFALKKRVISTIIAIYG